MVIEYIVYIVCSLIGTIGFAAFIYGIVNVIKMSTIAPTNAPIIDYTQEYTSRGFRRHAIVEYTLNDVAKRYVLRSRTGRRDSGTAKIYITKKEKIIERRYTFEIIAMAVIAMVLAITVVIMV